MTVKAFAHRTKPPAVEHGYCGWCGEPILGRRRGNFCKGHSTRWWNFWYARLPGYVIVVFARDLFTCQECGCVADVSHGWIAIRQQLHIDHIKPISRGGLHVLSNMRTLCKPCNIRRGNRDESWEPVAARRDKLKLARWVQ